MSFSVREIAAWVNGRVVNADRLGRAIDEIGVSKAATLSEAGSGDLAFFFSREYEAELLKCRAAVLITGEAFVKPLEAAQLPFWSSSAVIACKDPYLAMAILSEKIAGQISSVAHIHGSREGVKVHASAVVDRTVKLGPGVCVGPHCTIEKGACVGAGTVLYAGCYVGPSAKIGEDCVLFPNVTLYEWTEVGNRVRIHANSTIGADGFGYAPQRETGSEGEKTIGHQKIYHLGHVVIGDDVEIGANSCVDRSTFGETVIESKAKLDNHVHVGHNGRVAEGAVICGGVCMAGGASVGRFAYIGGMSGISNRVHVGDGAKVGACTLVTKDVPPGETAVGNPQRSYSEHFRAHAKLNQLIRRRVDVKSGKKE